MIREWIQRLCGMDWIVGVLAHQENRIGVLEAIVRDAAAAQGRHLKEHAKKENE